MILDKLPGMLLILREEDVSIYRIKSFELLKILKITENPLNFVKDETFAIIHDIPDLQFYEIKNVPNKLNFVDKKRWINRAYSDFAKNKEFCFKHMFKNIRNKILFASASFYETQKRMISALLSMRNQITGVYLLTMLENQMFDEMKYTKSRRWNLFIDKGEQKTKHILNFDGEFVLSRTFESFDDDVLLFNDLLIENEVDETLKYIRQNFSDIDIDGVNICYIQNQNNFPCNIKIEQKNCCEINFLDICKLLSIQANSFEELLVKYLIKKKFNFSCVMCHSNASLFHRAISIFLIVTILLELIFCLRISNINSFLIEERNMLSVEISKINEKMLKLSKIVPEKKLSNYKISIDVYKKYKNESKEFSLFLNILKDILKDEFLLLSFDWEKKHGELFVILKMISISDNAKFIDVYQNFRSLPNAKFEVVYDGSSHGNNTSVVKINIKKEDENKRSEY